MYFDLDHIIFRCVPYSFLHLLLCLDSKLFFLSLCSSKKNLNTLD